MRRLQMAWIPSLRYRLRRRVRARASIRVVCPPSTATCRLHAVRLSVAARDVCGACPMLLILHVMTTCVRASCLPASALTATVSDLCL